MSDSVRRSSQVLEMANTQEKPKTSVEIMDWGATNGWQLVGVATHPSTVSESWTMMYFAKCGGVADEPEAKKKKTGRISKNYQST